MIWKVLTIPGPGGEVKVSPDSNLYKPRGVEEVAAELQEKLNALASEGYDVYQLIQMGGGFVVVAREVDEDDDSPFIGESSQKLFDEVMDMYQAVPPSEREKACELIVNRYASSMDAEQIQKTIEDCLVVIEAHSHDGNVCYVAKTLQQVKKVLESKYQYRLS